MFFIKFNYIIVLYLRINLYHNNYYYQVYNIVLQKQANCSFIKY